MNVDIESLQARITAGKEMVNAVSRGDQRWSMTAPADPHDPDLVISDALKAGEEALAVLASLQRVGYANMSTWPATSDIVLPRDEAGRKEDPVTTMLGLAAEPWKLSAVATLLRESGEVAIPRRYEAEMAAALHWMVGLVIRHGDDWGQPYRAQVARLKAKIPDATTRAA